MSTLSTLATKNITNAKIGAQIETGKIVLTNFKKVLKPILPFMVKGYLDHPVADFVIANLCRAAIEVVPVLRSNKTLVFAVDSALLAASTEPIAQLGLPKLIEDNLSKVLDGVKIPKAE